MLGNWWAVLPCLQGLPLVELETSLVIGGNQGDNEVASNLQDQYPIAIWITTHWLSLMVDHFSVSFIWSTCMSAVKVNQTLTTNIDFQSRLLIKNVADYIYTFKFDLLSYLSNINMHFILIFTIIMLTYIYIYTMYWFQCNDKMVF